ncbi:MAG: hypothetical protein ACI9UQ_001076 [Candidatus Krumholzibacteriia bacterium]|jgi:hypothetical protein
MNSSIYKKLHLAVALFTVLAAGFGMQRSDLLEPRLGASLSRSDSVVQAKIDRKLAKLAGTYERPEHLDGLGLERDADRWRPEGANLTELKIAAIDHSKTMPQVAVDSFDKDGGVWNWDWLGPGNIGGRVRSILVHPTNTNILWAGSAGGGVWKTTDGGSSWYPLQNFLPSMEISAMAMDANNPDIIYAATGEGLRSGAAPSAGIYKSTNGGGTWQVLSGSFNTVDGYAINDLITHPTNSNILFAAVARANRSQSGHIWKSIDAGVTWLEVLETPTGATDLGIDTDNPNVVIMSTFNGVYRSHINGNAGTWLEFSTGAANRLPASTGRTTFAFGVGNDVVFASCDVPRAGNVVQGEIWRSLDNGVTWAWRSTPYHLSTQGSYNNVIWLEEGSTGSIMFGGLNVHKSIDGGTTSFVMSNWALFHGGSSAHADQHAIVPASNYLNGSSTIYFGNDGGVQKVTNGFLATSLSGWVNLANNLGVTQFYHADASPDGSLILGGTQDNDDLRYTRTSGAQNWYQAETGDGTYCFIDPVNTDNMYACYVWLQVQKSINAGLSYYSSQSGIGDAGDPARARFVAPFALDKSNVSNLIAGGRSLWRSTNKAGSWSEVLSPRTGNPLCSALEIDPLLGSEVIWAGYDDGSIWKTSNYTATWSEMEVGGKAGGGGDMPERVVLDIEVSPHNSNILLLAVGGYTDETVFMSFDNGANFVNRSGVGGSALPVIQVNTVTFHPDNPDWIYAGTDVGLYASEDLGLTWSVTPARQANESPVYAEVSDLIWHSGDTLVAVTFGRGMYECRPLSTVYVDVVYGGVEDGHVFTPFNTFTEGYNFMGNGATLVVKSGTYDEGGLVLDKRIILQNLAGPVVVK